MCRWYTVRIVDDHRSSLMVEASSAAVAKRIVAEERPDVAIISARRYRGAS